MGSYLHHAIVVTAQAEEWLAEAVGQAEAAGLGDLMTPVLVAPLNGVASFFVGPDGSKEGWAASDAADLRRSELLDALAGMEGIRWALVSYGDDHGLAARVERSDR